MNHRRLLGSIFLGAILAGGLAPPFPRTTAHALQEGQDPGTPPVEQALDASVIEAKIADIRASTTLGEEEKSGLEGTYRQALEALRSAAASEIAARDFRAELRDAPDRLARLRAQLAKPVEEATAEGAAAMGLPELEQMLANVTADLGAAREEQVQLEAEPGRRAERRRAIPDEMVQARQKLEEVTQALGQPPADGVPTETAEARRTLLRARKLQHEARVESLSQEVASYDARTELLSTRRQAAGRKVSRLEKLQQAWLDETNLRRQRAAEEAARIAREEALRAHPLLKDLAEENATLAEERSGSGDRKSLVQRIAEISGELTTAQANRDELLASYRRTTERASTLVRGGGLANLLLREQSRLPDIRALKADLVRLDDEIISTQRRQLVIQDTLVISRKDEEDVDSLLATLPPDTSPRRRQELETQASHILDDRRELLTALQRDYDRYLIDLQGLVLVKGEMAQKAGEFADFIDERLIWIRNDPPLRTADLVLAGHVLAEILHPPSWIALPDTLFRDTMAHPARNGFLWAAFIVLLAIQWPSRRRLRDLDEDATRLKTARFVQSLEALVINVIIVAPIPLLLLVLGWSLAWVPGPDPFRDQVVAGFRHAGQLLFALLLLRRLIRPDGFAESHLRWKMGALLPVYGHGTWLIPILMPPVFLLGALRLDPFDLRAATLARIVLVLVMAIILVFLAVLLRPRGSFHRATTKDRSAPSVQKWALGAYLLVFAFPVAIALLAILGYTYTATRVQVGVRTSMLLGIGLLFFRGLTLRWLLLARIRITLEQVRRQKEEAAQAEEGQEAPVVEPELSLTQIDQQTRTLIRWGVILAFLFGLYLIWSDVMPAVRAFDRVPLPWTRTVTDTEGVSHPEAVTLANLLLAILIVAFAILGTRQIPGLLELLILRRLNLGPGGSYAVVSLVRYVITVVGFVWAFATLGFGWSRVQWLVAAMTVGLGFGLQEIFANFVSGLIILFERPIRLGDWVTIGEVSGKVTRIRVRATTITDRDRKELVVPNKEFVIGRLINWTLTDSEVRLVLPVGIAYGSDTALAKRLLLQAAVEHEDVLRKPEPSVLFSAFGDSALQFQLRVFLDSPDRLPEISADLHFRIDELFREAGVVIAFPQQDLHVKGLPEDLLRGWGERRLEGPRGPAEAGGTPSGSPSG